MGGPKVYRPWRFTIVGAALLPIIGIVDYFAGAQTSLLALYIVPIAVIGWRTGLGPALQVAGVASAVWLGAHLADPGVPAVPIVLWNALNRAAAFVSVAVLSGLLHRETVFARTDALTGLPNRRALLEQLNTMLFKPRHSPTSICVAYLDVDDLREVNNRFGHARGDTLLQLVSDAIRETIRTGDLPARVGGDEFVIVLWRLQSDDAVGIAQRLVERIAELREAFSGAAIGVSVGVACFETVPERPEVMLEAADRALRVAKAAGKGQVRACHEGTA